MEIEKGLNYERCLHRNCIVRKSEDVMQERLMKKGSIAKSDLNHRDEVLEITDIYSSISRKHFI